MIKAALFSIALLFVVRSHDQLALVRDHTGKEYVILHDDTRLRSGTVLIGAISDNGTDDTADDYVITWVHPDDIR